MFTYKFNGDEITMTTPTGKTYTAKLDHSDAEMKGDPGVTSVSVRLVGKRTLVETDKRYGQIIGTWKIMVAPDGKTARASFTARQQSRTTVYTVTKQSAGNAQAETVY